MNEPLNEIPTGVLPDSAGRRKRKRGLTLTEVIAVAVIVVALLAIMFPVLSATKRTALSTQETAQLKNLAAAHAIYKADHDDGEPGTSIKVIAAGYAKPSMVALALDPFPEGWANLDRKEANRGPTSYKDSFKCLGDVTSDFLFQRFVQSQNGGWLASAGHGLKTSGREVVLKTFTYKRLTFDGAVVLRRSTPRMTPSPSGPQLGMYSSWLFSDEDVLEEFHR